MLSNLTPYRIVLASQSPRRQELLKALGIPFEVLIKNDTDESYPETLKKKEVAEYLARKKADACHKELEDKNLLLITADTIVVCEGHLLGKPANAAEARQMLRMLSGKPHKVITGVALTTSAFQRSFSVKTKVYFKRLSNDEIEYYVTHFPPLDKAGAYGIQDWIGLTGIDHIEGSYVNVVGLPVQRLYAELQRIPTR